ncbi:MAG: hypothetical protein V3U76_11570 [Granulosicoccus sp.]
MTKPAIAVFKLLTMRQVLMLTVALCLLLAALIALFLLPGYAQENAEQSRVLRVEEQRYAQLVSRLHTALAEGRLSDFDTSLSGARINLLESLELLSEVPGVLTVRYELLAQPFNTYPSFPEGNETGVSEIDIAEPMTRFRVNIRLRLLHGRVLIDVLDRIRNAAGSWPVEVRACELQRAAERAGIDVQCAIDIMHWVVETDVRG